MDGRAPVERGRDAGPPPSQTTGPHPVAAGRYLLASIGRILVTTGGLLVVYFLLPLNRSFTGWTVLTLVAGLLAVALLAAWQVRSILRASRPALRAAEAVALSLPLFLLLFATAYVVLDSTDPLSFSQSLSRIDALYFVITVFTTVGFGDITPVSEVARVLTTVQMIGDLVLIGLVLKVFLGAVDISRGRAGGR